jgi:glycosyltransferase involved in cell wall biosynthesis
VSIKLSVSMIVRNEESCLAKCLESIRGADELVVVDTGSTDATKAIASSFGARLFDFKWIDDFAAARNYSLQQCTGDWVFIVDADWELEPGGMAKIRAAAENACPGDKVIDVNVVGNNLRYQQPLLFRRCPEVFWKGTAHNYLSVVQSNSSDITIRAGYSAAHRKDPDRTLRILTKALKKNSKLVREKYYLAREYYYRKDYKNAINWYRSYLEKAFWRPERADAQLTLAKCYWATSQGELARRACLQAISDNANFKEALLFMADLSWPKNAKRWREFAEHATNEDVLFVRV